MTSVHRGILLGLLTLGSFARAGTLDCSTAPTAEDFVRCFRRGLIRPGTGEVQEPTLAQRSAWRDAVAGMMAGDCSALGPPLAPAAVRFTWVESANLRPFCVLYEINDADDGGVLDLGWGLVMANPEAKRELCHQAPHPIADLDTDSLAVTVFKATESRCFMMAGAHRDAGTTISPCQGLRAADVCHNDATMFQAGTEALAHSDAGAPLTVLQWHGMADMTCPQVDVYLTEGLSTMPAAQSATWTLTATIAATAPAWRTGVSGSGLCGLNGTLDVQTRLLNGVDTAAVCTTSATVASGRVLHLELAPGFRDPAAWRPIVAAVWPEPDAGAGELDGGELDGGELDGGELDGGELDGGESDGGESDGGESDGGESDAGSSDAGSSDAGSSDAGSSDGGADIPAKADEVASSHLRVGCQFTAEGDWTGGLWMMLLALWAFGPRRGPRG